MVVFEFLVDENVLAEDLTANPSSEDLAVLEETFFVFPVRLNINGREMFGLTDNQPVMYGGQARNELEVKDQANENRWLSLPILQLALIGLQKARIACNGEKTSLALPGTGLNLIFVPTEDKIEVRSQVNGKVEMVECQTLIEAFSNFKGKTISFLKDRIPDIEKHPQWHKIVDKEFESHRYC